MSALLLDLRLTLRFFERIGRISGGSCDCAGWFLRKTPPQMAAAKMEGQDLQKMAHKWVKRTRAQEPLRKQGWI